MTHTFSPEADRRAEALAATATLVASIVAVIVFFPAEGRVLAPVHGILDALLGHATFVLPLGIALAAALGFARRARPQLALPRQRLVGLGVIALALLPADSLLGQPTGLVGEWFTSFLLELLGGPLTVILTVLLVIAGAALTFDLRHVRRWRAAR